MIIRDRTAKEFRRFSWQAVCHAVHQLHQNFISRSCCKDVNARQPSLVTLERYHSGKAIRSGQTPLCLGLYLGARSILRWIAKECMKWSSVFLLHFIVILIKGGGAVEGVFTSTVVIVAIVVVVVAIVVAVVVGLWLYHCSRSRHRSSSTQY